MTLSTLGSICCLVALACGYFIFIYLLRKGELAKHSDRQKRRRHRRDDRDEWDHLFDMMSILEDDDD